MDHLVLIPQDFNLVVTSEKLPQDNVTVWSNQRIAQGTIYYPFQGTVRIDKLNVFSMASDDDVSWQLNFLLVFTYLYPSLCFPDFHENWIMLIENNYEFMFLILLLWVLKKETLRGALKKFVFKKLSLPWLEQFTREEAQWKILSRNFLKENHQTIKLLPLCSVITSHYHKTQKSKHKANLWLLMNYLKCDEVCSPFPRYSLNYKIAFAMTFIINWWESLVIDLVCVVHLWNFWYTYFHISGALRSASEIHFIFFLRKPLFLIKQATVFAFMHFCIFFYTFV